MSARSTSRPSACAPVLRSAGWRRSCRLASRGALARTTSLAPSATRRPASGSPGAAGLAAAGADRGHAIFVALALLAGRLVVVTVPVTRGAAVSVLAAPRLGGDRLEHLGRQVRAVLGVDGRRLDADHDLLVVELLEHDARAVARRHVDPVLEQRLDVGWRDARPQARTQVDGVRLAQRDDRHVQHDAVGDHDLLFALAQDGVEEPERADGALDSAGQPAALQAHALTDAERPRAEQHGAGEQVAERLLRGETDDDGGERTADGQ